LCIQGLYAGCIPILTNGPSWPGSLQCYNSVVSCTVATSECLGKNIPGPLKLAYDIASCAYSICTACDGIPGHSGICGIPSPSTDPTDQLVTKLVSQANDVQAVIAPDLYFFGQGGSSGGGGASGDWFSVTDTNALETLLDQFNNDIQTNSDGAQFITIAEQNVLLALPLPSPLAPSDLNALIDRWNNTMSNYALGILTMGQLPVGADTNFIAFDQWSSLCQTAAQVLQTYQNEGYTDPIQAWFATQNALSTELQGGSSGTCAQITLQIDQTAILTENAFHATLQLNNNGAAALTNVTVNLNVQNQTGQDATSLFGIQPPILTGSLTAVDGTGTLAANASGAAQWTLIPSLDAAPQVTTNYLVSGTISYLENGLTVTIPLSAQSITVQPSPQLYLKYFLQRDVYGDDPFTPEIEPSIPFPLAVMVQNSGYGSAYNFQLTSAEPTIVDNQKGLLIDFNIIGAQVNNQPVAPSLTVAFGDIAPNSTQIAVWWLTSSLDGVFSSYSATFQDVTALGNLQLSPVQNVQIYEITHLVQADGAWNDGLPDFLVIDTNNVNSLPNMLYLNDGTTQPVSVVQTATNNGPVTSGNLEVQITAIFPAGFTYMLVPDPANGQFALENVLYTNGNSFLTNNFWITDRTFIGVGLPPLLQTNLNLFVYHTNAGPDTFTLVYAALTNSSATNPPVSSVFSLPAQSPPTFAVGWSGTSYDSDAPIAYYDIYVSDNGGPFTLWQGHTTGIGAFYDGTQGHTYAFYSIATDTAGNRQPTPLQPQAQTTVSVNTTPPTISVVSNVTLNAGQTLSLSVTASDPNPLNTLTFSLGPDAPVGVVINPSSGQITWATSPAFGRTTNLINIIATDNGQPPLSATATVTVVLLPIPEPPVLALISNVVVAPQNVVRFQVYATDPNGYQLSYSLASNAPPTAQIDCTNGIFDWVPTRAYAETTNLITVIVTDNGTPPLSASQTFQIIVLDYLELTLGTTNLEAGQSSEIPIYVDSDAGMTNLAFTVQVPPNTLTNLSLVSTSPQIASATLQNQTSNFLISFSTMPNQFLQGTQLVSQLNFLALTNVPSAFVTLAPQNLSALKPDGLSYSNYIAHPGLVELVEDQPLMLATAAVNSNVNLTFFGKVGASYQLQGTTNIFDPNSWRPLLNYMQTNGLMIIGVPATNQMFYYRLLQQ
jgi:hypothetical protein